MGYFLLHQALHLPCCASACCCVTTPNLFDAAKHRHPLGQMVQLYADGTYASLAVLRLQAQAVMLTALWVAAWIFHFVGYPLDLLQSELNLHLSAVL